VTQASQTDETTVAAPAARTSELTKVYGHGDAAVHALRGVTLEIERAKWTAIMGPSGSGKSTLLHCMAGLDRPTSGRVWIGETDLTKLREKKLTVFRRTHIGFIFQAYNLLPTLNAQENIELPSRIARKSPDGTWMSQVLQVLGLGDRLTHVPAELSGGEQQRVAAARAMAAGPEVIFADEPTGNLVSNSSAQLLDFMRKSVDEFGQTIVMVTHDAQAASRADRVVFLADGQVQTEISAPTYERILDSMKALGG
jgi:putative ABC transport system ATP-binding protein